jgi:probable phosphoglycerate mutase
VTTFLLIRHAHHDLVGKAIAGRLAGTCLSSEGQRGAESLAERLVTVPIASIYSSPLERAQATAAIIARRLSLNVCTCEQFNEIDFGEWQGRAFDDLDDDPQWMRFNIFRSGTCPPRGEPLLQVQARMVAALDDLRARFPNEVVAVVGHGDPIKSVIACYAGIPLDLMLRIEISPASISIVSIGDFGPNILCLNHTGELPRLA